MTSLAYAAAAAIVASTAYCAALRPRHLRWGASDAEVAARWPGDELVIKPRTRAVRAVTVHAPAEKLWPWIMQIGREQGGFYSYAWLENLIGADIHNVYRLIPNLPERRVGDTVWMGPRDKFNGMARMVVGRIVPRRAMVLVLPGDAARVFEQGRASSVWSFVLEPTGEKRTRLIMLSVTEAPRIWDFVFWESAHFVMERKMMLTLKRLAERSRDE